MLYDCNYLLELLNRFAFSAASTNPADFVHFKCNNAKQGYVEKIYSYFTRV